MEKLAYALGRAFGTAVSYLFFGALGLLFKGIVTASRKYHALIGVYTGLLFIAFASFLLEEDTQGSAVMVLFFLVSAGAGIKILIEEYPMKKARKMFRRIFEGMGFTDKNGNTPYYVNSSQLTAYTAEFIFRTLIPLDEWKKKKEQLEIYFNEKIIDIHRSEDDNRLIHITIQTGELPQSLEWNEYYNTYRGLIIGEGIDGLCELDLGYYPHAFICGETGCGKSNIMKCLIHQCLVKQYEVKLIDFKRGVSFAYFGSAIQVYYEYETTVRLLKDIVREAERRLDLFRENRVDNINTYNQQSGYTKELKRIVVFIDELAELLKTRDKEISKSLYDSLETLTRISRATGIHLIIGVQRPDSTIITGQIKSNIPYRICGHFVDKEPSRIVMGNDIANTLPNIKGRFIIRDYDFHEVQAFYISDNFLNAAYKRYSNAMDTPVTPKTAPESVESTIDNKKTVESLKFDFSDI